MRSLGRIKDTVKTNLVEEIQFENGIGKVEVVCDGILRTALTQKPELPIRNNALLDPDFVTDIEPDDEGDIGTAEFRFDCEENLIAVTSDDRKIFEGSLSFGDDVISMRFPITENQKFYGFGEKYGTLEKSGSRMTMWNMDIFSPAAGNRFNPHSTSADPLYASVNFFICVENGKAWGIFIDTVGKTHFDIGLETGKHFGIGVEDDILDVCFIDGPSMKDVVRRFTKLTGRIGMPPMWSLGYHQCRWSYGTESEVEEVAGLMRKHEIPCDSIWLDIDYMDKYKVFTFDGNKFPDPKRLSESLMNKGMRLVTIIDPGFADDDAWDLCSEGKERELFFRDGDEFYCGKVWPGETLFPDFRKPEAREWFGKLVTEFSETNGVGGIWFDMNEPADGKDEWNSPVHLAFGNSYPHLELMGASEEWEKSNPDTRKFFLTRAAMAGSQRYSAIWTGDNISRWEHLEQSIPTSLNLGLSGMPFVGADVGGFAGNCDGELFARWIQYAAFTPFFRNHSVIGSSRQEPWSFDDEVLDISRKYIQLRYRLMPYIYSMFRKAYEQGDPVMRPMIWEFPDDDRFVNESGQYMFGDSLLIAPVFSGKAAHKWVKIPEGKWVDFHTGEILEGPSDIRLEPELHCLPIFMKGGSILPMWDAADSTELFNRSKITYEVWPGGDGEFVLYEDDGKSKAYERGEWSKITLRSIDGRKLIREATEGVYRGVERVAEVVFKGKDNRTSTVKDDHKGFVVQA